MRRGTQRAADDIEGEGQGGGGDQEQPEQPLPRGRHEAESRDEQVELLLHCQVPGVQDRIGQRRRERVASQPETEVLEVEGLEDERWREDRAIDRFQQHEARQRRHQYRQEERGCQPAEAGRVEVGQRGPALQKREQVGTRDHVARDHEEDIDAQEARGHESRIGMEQHHQHHRDGAQRVDLGQVSTDQLRLFPRVQTGITPPSGPHRPLRGAGDSSCAKRPSRVAGCR